MTDAAALLDRIEREMERHGGHATGRICVECGDERPWKWVIRDILHRERAALATSDSEEAPKCCDDPGGAFCRITTGHHMCMTGNERSENERADSEEALSGVARDLDETVDVAPGVITGADVFEAPAAVFGAAVAVPLDEIDPERLARALRLTYGYTFPKGGTGDWVSDARFVADHYRDAKP